MGRFKLVAVGDHAKQLTMCDGAPDLLLWQDRPIQLGRAVREGDGYRYPNNWNSLSSRHCNLQFRAALDGGEGEWLVTDTSTNGTYVNGTKVGKNNSAVLRVGDRLGLSIMATSDSASFVNSVEYQLEHDPDAPTPHAPVVAPAASRAQQLPVAPNQQAPASHKRRQEGSVSPNAHTAAAAGVGVASGGPKKRLRSEEAEGPELAQLRKTNQELRGKLEASRQELERVEQQLQEVEAQHAKDLQERDEQHHAELAATSREAVETLEAERSRTKQLQQQLAEETASTAEQAAQLSCTKQQLDTKTEEAARLTSQLQQAQDDLAARDADITRLQQELAQEQQVVRELRVRLALAEGASAALEEAQQQLQVRGEALGVAQQALREEQRARGTAEAAVRAAEKALERAKTSLQERLDSERENLLVYGRSVQEAHADLAQKLLAQQAEHERHQRDTEQLNAQLKGLLDKLAAESSRHSSAVQGLVHGVDEGLQTLTAASVEAGLDGLQQQQQPGGDDAGGQDVDMEGAEDGQEPTEGGAAGAAAALACNHQQQHDAPMTQPINSNHQPSGSNANTNSTPHQSQTGGADGFGDAGSTPAATQEQPAGSNKGNCLAHTMAAATAALVASAGMIGTARAEGPYADTEAGDYAGQTQEVFPATLAFPVLGTAALVGPTPALFGTPGGPGSAPAPTPATAAGGGATCVLGPAGEGAGGCMLLAVGAQGLGPVAMQQQFQDKLAAVLLEKQQAGEEQEEDVEAGDVQQQQQEEEEEEEEQAHHAAHGGVTAAAADDSQEDDMVQGSQDTADEQDEQQQQQQQQQEDVEVAETQQEEDALPSARHQQHLQPGSGHVHASMLQQRHQQQQPLLQQDETQEEAGHQCGEQNGIPQQGMVAEAGAAGAVGAAAAAANGEDGTADADMGDDGEQQQLGAGEQSEQLGCTDDDPSSSHRGSQQHQQLYSSEQQQGSNSQDNQGWCDGVGQQPSSYPLHKTPPVKSLLGSSGSPARPQSQPMGAIDLNKRLPVSPGVERDPYAFRG